MIFTSTLSLDLCAKTSLGSVVEYELIEAEEQQETDEEDSKEEHKKNDYLNFYDGINYNPHVEGLQVMNNQFSWKLHIKDVLLQPPKSK